MLIDEILLKSLLNKAMESDKKRANYDLCTSLEDGSQRMLNALQPGMEVPIHRHCDTTETVFVVSGRLTEIFYDDKGLECARYDLDPQDGRFGLQIPKGMWHTVVVDEPSIIFEAKDGAYVSPARSDIWHCESNEG